MLLHVRWRNRSLAPELATRGPIRINCPVCGAKDTPVSDVWVREETAQLIIKSTTNWVKCGACGAELFSSEPADSLFGRTPSQLEAVVYRRISPIAKLLVVIACFTFFMPLLGLMTSIPALIATWRMKNGWRTAARVAFVLAIIAHIGFAILFSKSDPSQGVYRR